MSIDLVSQIEYPDSDGLPMSDNTVQHRWIFVIENNLDFIFSDEPEVFVAGDLLWYPVEGDNTTRIGPDVMVALGRPKGDRRSYMQWDEDGIAPQVVFEVLSPGNRAGEMEQKRHFYQRYGVEEYYEFDPDRIKLRGWLRNGEELAPIAQMNGWTSPTLGIRFELGDDLTLYDPQGNPFLSYVEVRRRLKETENLAELERQRAERADQRAEESDQRAEQADQRAERADQRAEESDQRAEQERQRAERLAERLRALGLDPEV